MARRYTMTDVTTTGSSVQTFRSAMSGSVLSAGKGYSDDNRMRNMFPQSPLYQTGSSGLDLNEKMDDSAIIENFKTYDNIIISGSYDFNGSGPNSTAYMDFIKHPQSPAINITDLHMPISGNISDHPYQGHPNLQVNGINPLDERSYNENGLLRQRTLEDGGFGTKNQLKNYSSKEVKDSIGKFFTNVIYNNSNRPEEVNISKFNSLGNSTMYQGQKDANLSSGVNNFVPQNGNN